MLPRNHKKGKTAKKTQENAATKKRKMQQVIIAPF
jgi:hypothetical protein